MLTYLRDSLQFFLLIIVWVVVGAYAGPLLFALLPLSVFLMKSRGLWADVIFGFLIILVLSDMTPFFTRMKVVKDAKNTYIVALTLIFALERYRFFPYSRLFNIFLPFFLYSLFPLVFSNNLAVALQKTLSFALMYLIVPNYILYNFRLQGWPFFRNLVFFMCAILVAGLGINFMGDFFAYVGGRFRGLFGNPNGMAIYCYLVIVLATVVMSLKKDLFKWKEKLVVFGILTYFLLASGSRASLVSSLIFLIFHRFFSASPFIGFIGLIALFGVSEVVSNNMESIVIALGMEKYFRLETLRDGSGRYFAWEFTWGHIQDYFVFGGGFANDERIMRKWRIFLERMGHQGGVHNSYLSMWLNVGIVGLVIYLRSFLLLFFKSSKLAPISLAMMFSVLFSIMYESWLVGSLNPYTIVLLMIMTVVSEEEIAGAERYTSEEEAVEQEEGTSGLELRTA
ncbi:MAG: O-antigen ligase family protein [Flavobacteriales bacterium]|nr:O-antigen ligase family protein [Flavobacteriales bacterium]